MSTRRSRTGEWTAEIGIFESTPLLIVRIEAFEGKSGENCTEDLREEVHPDVRPAEITHEGQAETDGRVEAAERDGADREGPDQDGEADGETEVVVASGVFGRGDIEDDEAEEEGEKEFGCDDRSGRPWNPQADFGEGFTNHDLPGKALGLAAQMVEALAGSSRAGDARSLAAVVVERGAHNDKLAHRMFELIESEAEFKPMTEWQEDLAKRLDRR